MLKFIESDPKIVSAFDSKLIRYDPIEGILVISEPAPNSQRADSTVRHIEVEPRAQHLLVRFNDAPNLSFDDLPNSVQEINFTMGFAKKMGEKLEQTCTTIQSQVGAQKRPFSTEIGRMGAFFPNLDALVRNASSQTCDLILFEANIDLETIPSVPNPRDPDHLKIMFNVDLNCEREYHDWRVQTNFRIDRGVESCGITRELICEKLEYSRLRRLAGIPLHSQWWVQLFSKVIHRRIEVRKAQAKALEKLCHAHW